MLSGPFLLDLFDTHIRQVVTVIGFWFTTREIWGSIRKCQAENLPEVNHCHNLGLSCLGTNVLVNEIDKVETWKPLKFIDLCLFLYQTKYGRHNFRRVIQFACFSFYVYSKLGNAFSFACFLLFVCFFSLLRSRYFFFCFSFLMLNCCTITVCQRE